MDTQFASLKRHQFSLITVIIPLRTTEDKLWEIPFQPFAGAKLWSNLSRKREEFIKKSKKNKELTREIIWQIHLSLTVPSK